MPPEALAANVALAYQARAEVPWGPGLPEADLPRRRPAARQRDRAARVDAGRVPRSLSAAGPATARRPARPPCRSTRRSSATTRSSTTRGGSDTDQCSRESIAQGMATCTGLSIMLVEACRAVGGAGADGRDRVVAGPGRQPHLGRGLGRRLAFRRRRRARREGPRPRLVRRRRRQGDQGTCPQNAIYAVTYAPTGASLPARLGRPRVRVPAENVTDRYTAKASPDGTRHAAADGRGPPRGRACRGRGDGARPRDGRRALVRHEPRPARPTSIAT